MVGCNGDSRQKDSRAAKPQIAHGCARQISESRVSANDLRSFGNRRKIVLRHKAGDIMTRLADRRAVTRLEYASRSERDRSGVWVDVHTMTLTYADGTREQLRTSYDAIVSRCAVEFGDDASVTRIGDTIVMTRSDDGDDDVSSDATRDDVTVGGGTVMTTKTGVMTTHTTRRTVRVPDRIWYAAQTIAELQGETVSDVIRRALEQYVERATHTRPVHKQRRD